MPVGASPRREREFRQRERKGVLAALAERD